MAMAELISEKEHAALKGTLQQWWRVGPLRLTLEITDEVDPRFKRFDEPQCFIPYNRRIDGGTEEDGTEYDSPETKYQKFSTLCKEHNIPFVVEQTDWHQNHFYIPAANKMQFLEALEQRLANSRD